MRLLLARLDGEMVKSKDLTRLIHEAMAHNAELGELLEVLIRALYLGGEAKDIEQILDWYDPYAVEFEDVDWLLVTPVLRYALATSFGEDGADEHDARFSENIAKYEESLPVMVNLEVLEQFARKLPGGALNCRHARRCSLMFMAKLAHAINKQRFVCVE